MTLRELVRSLLCLFRPHKYRAPPQRFVLTKGEYRILLCERCYHCVVKSVPSLDSN